MKNFSKIKEYLAGNLSEKDKAIFEAEIAQDETLAKEVAIQHLEEKVLEKMLKEKVKADVLQLKEKYDQKSSFNFWWVILIVILLLLIMAIFYVKKEKPKHTNQAIAMTELSKYPVSSERSVDDGVTKNWKTAIENVIRPNSAKINESISYFQSIPDTAIIFGDAQFFLAYAYLKTGKYTAAIDRLNYVRQSDIAISNSKNEIDYYLILAYLANDETSKAIELLNEIKFNKKHHYNDTKPIKSLDSQLNSFWRSF